MHLSIVTTAPRYWGRSGAVAPFLPVIRVVATVGGAGRPYPALSIPTQHSRQTHVFPPTTNLPYQYLKLASKLLPTVKWGENEKLMAENWGRCNGGMVRHFCQIRQLPSTQIWLATNPARKCFSFCVGSDNESCNEVMTQFTTCKIARLEKVLAKFLPLK